jgi:O-antigen/teichoic acid export membrane protein
MALIMRKQQKLYQSGLKSIAKGGGLILGGSFSRIVLTFLLNIIIMRYISQSEFGFFSICIVVVNIMALLSGLGFQRALPGYISCQHERILQSLEQYCRFIQNPFLIKYIFRPLTIP